MRDSTYHLSPPNQGNLARSLNIQSAVFSGGQQLSSRESGLPINLFPLPLSIQIWILLRIATRHPSTRLRSYLPFQDFFFRLPTGRLNLYQSMRRESTYVREAPTHPGIRHQIPRLRTRIFFSEFRLENVLSYRFNFRVGTRKNNSESENNFRVLGRSYTCLRYRCHRSSARL